MSYLHFIIVISTNFVYEIRKKNLNCFQVGIKNYNFVSYLVNHTQKNTTFQFKTFFPICDLRNYLQKQRSTKINFSSLSSDL